MKKVCERRSHAFRPTKPLTLPTHVLHMCCNLIDRILYGFSVMIQKQFFCVFQLFASLFKHLYQKNTWKNSQINSFSENDLKHEINLANNLLRKDSKLPIPLEQFFVIYSYLKRCVWLLLAAATLHVPSASLHARDGFQKLN